MIVLGAKGHAKDVLVVLNETVDEQTDFVFFDDYTKPEESLFLNTYPIVHSLEKIDFKIHPNFASAIGVPKLRRQVVDKFLKEGGVYKSVISKHAIIGLLDVQIGIGSNIMPYVFISNSVYIGVGCLLNVGCYIHHDVRMGDFCDISPSAKLLGRVTIGNNCNIGAGAIILPNISLGDNVTVGAGSIVVADCLTPSTIVGVPGRIKNTVQ